MTLHFSHMGMSMPLEDEMVSIFDEAVAGQYADDGNYYAIMWNAKNKSHYALTSADYRTAIENWGKSLEPGEVAVFRGEYVRGITEAEEFQCASDTSDLTTDIWGNVQLELSECSYITLAKLLNPKERVKFRCSRFSEILQSVCKAGFTKSDKIGERKSQFITNEIVTETGTKYLYFSISPAVHAQVDVEISCLTREEHFKKYKCGRSNI